MAKTMISVQQLTFAEAFLVSDDRKLAAVAAGYAEKHAAVQGYKLLKKPAVIAYLAARRAGRTAEELAPQREASAVGKSTECLITGETALDFLRNVMNSTEVTLAQRIRIASALLPYENKKGGGAGGLEAPKGKKAEREELANAPNKFTTVAQRPVAGAPLKAVK